MDELFWFETGTGRPLVLLHGGYLDHHMWDDQIPVFAPHYRVIAPDARGHGRTANASEPFRSADDLAVLLRDLDCGPVILVGVSMGAGTAVDTALEYPELVSAVVVTGAGTSEPYFADPWTTRTWSDWYAAMAVGDLNASVEGMVLFAAGPHRAVDDLDPRFVARVRTMARGTMSKHRVGETNWLRPVSDTWTRIGTIKVPVLAINGRLDSPDHIGMAERLISTVADGRSVFIADTAHFPNMERPEAYNEILTSFLDTLEQGSAG